MNKEREAFEESNNIKPDWSFKFDNELQQYVELDHEMQAQVEEFNEHWDTFRAGWQAAKAQALPEGLVLVPKTNSDKGIESMAMRYRHDFPLLDADYQEAIKSQMRQLYEEAVGLGFYRHKAQESDND